MRTATICGALIALTITAAVAQESTFTVDKLQSICEGYLKFPGNREAGEPCLYYVLGITDGFLHAGYFKRSICVPPSIRLPTMIRAIMDDLHADPPPLSSGQASTYVYRALMRAYPCRR